MTSSVAGMMRTIICFQAFRSHTNSVLSACRMLCRQIVSCSGAFATESSRAWFNTEKKRGLTTAWTASATGFSSSISSLPRLGMNGREVEQAAPLYDMYNTICLPYRTVHTSPAYNNTLSARRRIEFDGTHSPLDWFALPSLFKASLNNRNLCSGFADGQRGSWCAVGIKSTLCVRRQQAKQSGGRALRNALDNRRCQGVIQGSHPGRRLAHDVCLHKTGLNGIGAMLTHRRRLAKQAIQPRSMRNLTGLAERVIRIG